MKPRLHEQAWRIEADSGEDYGVVVRQHRYWWLLCPATATLYLGDDKDLLDCSDATCDWPDVHKKAEKLRRHLVGQGIGRAD